MHVLTLGREGAQAGHIFEHELALLSSDLDAIQADVLANGPNPAPKFGRQERPENPVSRYL